MKTEKLPQVVDLFSGCGGLGLGFAAAGFPSGPGVDIVQAAVDTASFNLFWRYGVESQQICADVTKLSGSELSGGLGSEGCIVVGGPPCQAYSNIGIAKLRSLQRKHTSDKRGWLFQDFLRMAFELNARAVVMENVPNSTSYGGTNIPQEACRQLEQHGYRACWTILNAADYGVPQLRERVFVIGIAGDEKGQLELPAPTHRNPDGKVTQSQARARGFADDPTFRVPPPAAGDLPAWITVGEAIDDLPSLLASPEARYILHQMNTELPYAHAAANAFQREMREWFGYELSGVTANGIRKTPRDYPIFAAMQPGDDFIAASRIADERLAAACHAANVPIEPGNERYEALRRAIVPPYSRDKFDSKWQKLRADAPSHTLPAHLAVDAYSHIHPWEPRGISVREAARLQSFPDDIAFQGSMGDAFRQIGNAVPPLMARAIAQEIRKVLEEQA